MLNLDDLRDEEGRLPAHAWPGGYPIIYLTRDGEVYCAACANKDDLYSTPVAYRTYFEGPDLHCDECNTLIESAYGDTNNEDKN